MQYFNRCWTQNDTTLKAILRQLKENPLEVIETEEGILFKPKKSIWDLIGSGSAFAASEEMKKELGKLREQDA